MVVGFRYLWSWEHEAGYDKPRKMRPCLIVAAEPGEKGVDVKLAPISHRPMTKTPFIEVPKGFFRQAGLDGLACYVLAGELNIMSWPSSAWDRRMLEMGRVPDGFVKEVVQRLGESRAYLRAVDRDKMDLEIVAEYQSRRDRNGDR